jgi:drug/metabolite transporter (DMT)-like permease
VIDGSDLAGLGLAACAAACFDGATAFQALEARQLRSHAMRPRLIARLAQRPRWLAATGLAIAGWPLQLAALSLAPLTLVQPTLALGIILLLALGSRVLGERVRPGAVLSALAIAAGVAGIALSAPPNSETYTTGPELWIVLGALATLAAVPYVAGRSNPRVGGMLVVGAGAAFAASAFMSKLIADELAAGRIGLAIAWGAGVVAAAGLGLLGEMSALQRREAARVAPPIFVIETVVPVLCAPWLTGEDWGGTPLGGAAIAASLLVVAAGGATLAQSRAVETMVGSGSVPAPR